MAKFKITASEKKMVLKRRKALAADAKLANIVRKIKLELADVSTKELEEYIGKYPKLEQLLYGRIERMNKLKNDLSKTVGSILKEAIGDKIVRR